LQKAPRALGKIVVSVPPGQMGNSRTSGSAGDGRPAASGPEAQIKPAASGSGNQIKPAVREMSGPRPKLRPGRPQAGTGQFGAGGVSLGFGGVGSGGQSRLFMVPSGMVVL
jgi:hypothetical protein